MATQEAEYRPRNVHGLSPGWNARSKPAQSRAADLTHARSLPPHDKTATSPEAQPAGPGSAVDPHAAATTADRTRADTHRGPALPITGDLGRRPSWSSCRRGSRSVRQDGTGACS